MDRRQVIMPSEEDLKQMAEKGHQQHKKRGWYEIGIGSAMLLLCVLFFAERALRVPDYADSRDNFPSLLPVVALFGLVLLITGITRQFREKKRKY
ncbi:MAG: hypothetical protein H6510_12635 [Acidobacteria bacterium]|nr:hypothetical protein [Acidobacteriota bacterium]MCB9398653.1 hypothetical protein [Acidobacteriota bacterium]